VTTRRGKRREQRKNDAHKKGRKRRESEKKADPKEKNTRYGEQLKRRRKNQ